MAKIRITQIKSVIDRSERQKRTIEALGLKKINHTDRGRSYSIHNWNGSQSEPS